MPIELTEPGLQLLKWGLMIGVPSFFAGWFTHVVFDWLMSPPGASGKDRS